MRLRVGFGSKGLGFFLLGVGLVALVVLELKERGVEGTEARANVVNKSIPCALQVGSLIASRSALGYVGGNLP